MSDIVAELRSPTTGWSGDAACVGAEDAERGAAEIERLRVVAADALDVLDRAQSGFISGCGSDLIWQKKRDEVMENLKAVLQQSVPSETKDG